MQPQVPEKSFWRFAIAGGVGGICAAFVCYPLDTIKTRLQASTATIDYIQTSRHISLYKGFSMSFMSIPLAGVYLGTYESVKQLLPKYRITDVWLVNPISAFIGQCVATTIGTPLDVVRQQLQIGLRATLTQNLQYVYKQEGIRGFYAGYIANLLRNVPFSIINMTLYETLKKRSKQNNGGEELNTLQHATNGMISNSITALVTHPMDCIKTKLMTQTSGHYKGVLDCFRKIVIEDGIKNLFTALHYRVGLTAISGFVFFSVFETMKRLL
jgi:solute carrier family 25 S-adenosylmethionine transporter 26